MVKGMRGVGVVMLAALSVIILGAAMGATTQAKWKPADGPLMTRWAKQVTPANVLPDYPRPQMVRKSWVNLNGLWDVAFTGKDDPKPVSFGQKIMVPFAVESAMSGVMRRIEAKDRIWYKRSFNIPASWKNQRVLLHFGAVDWESSVYVNGKPVGKHTGGYDPFTYDITSAIKPGTSQDLLVSVWDPSTDGNQPVGKQSLSPGGCFYTPCSGIWQTVWLEALPANYISSFKMVPDVDKGCLRLSVAAAGAGSGTVTAVAFDKGRKIAQVTGKAGQALVIPVKNAKLWSPSSPYLYNLKLTLKSGDVKDTVDTYFAMRKISVGPDADGITRILLNNKFVFQLGPLDQGYWPESNYTPPCEDAILFDLKMLKKFGFNMIRKHIKVEPARWYYWCDKLGFVVWQDMPSLPLREPSIEGKRNYESELERIVGALYNVPSIIMWVPFNESWGQFDTPRIVDKIRSMDHSRLINNASGWVDNKVGDVVDIHTYPGPYSPKPEANRAAVLGEFGGLGMIYRDHIWNKDGWGYDLLGSKDDLMVRYEKLYRDMKKLVSNPGLSAAVYTQVSDIESEINGLMTYDRRIIKIDPMAAAMASRYLFPPEKTDPADRFIGETAVELVVPANAKVRYTLDGSKPTAKSSVYTAPIKLTASTTIKASAFLSDGSSSRVASFSMKKVDPMPAQNPESTKPGLQTSYYEGGWNNLPDFDELTPSQTFISKSVDLNWAKRDEHYAMKFEGWIDVPDTGVYTFYCTADDCASLIIDGKTVIDDRIGHGSKELFGSAALEAGAHSICLLYSQSTGGKALRMSWSGPDMPKQTVPASALSFTRTLPIKCLPPEPVGYTLKFVGETDAVLGCPYDEAVIHYTTDGTDPADKSTRYTGPVHLTKSTTIKAVAYMDGLEPSAVQSLDYANETPVPAASVASVEPGLLATYYQLPNEAMPDFGSLTPLGTYKLDSLTLPETPKREYFALKFEGYIKVPVTGAYAFYFHADDQARLIIGGKTIVDKVRFDEAPKKGEIVLEAGLHPLTVLYTQGNGDAFINLQMEGPGTGKRDVGAGMLLRKTLAE